MEELKSVRPSKKQRELLTFIEQFITEHGYSPSYREIMSGCNYTSVATVSLHVNSLIKRGHLRKRDKSARSLEVVSGAVDSQASKPAENWLVAQVETLLQEAEAAVEVTEAALNDLAVLVRSLAILGLHEPAAKAEVRVAALQQAATDDTDTAASQT